MLAPHGPCSTITSSRCTTRIPERCAPVTRSTSIAWIFVESITKLSFNPMQAVSMWTEKQARCGKECAPSRPPPQSWWPWERPPSSCASRVRTETSCQSPVQPRSTLATVLAAKRRRWWSHTRTTATGAVHDQLRRRNRVHRRHEPFNCAELVVHNLRDKSQTSRNAHGSTAYSVEYFSCTPHWRKVAASSLLLLQFAKRGMTAMGAIDSFKKSTRTIAFVPKWQRTTILHAC